MPKRIRVEGMNITTTPAELHAGFSGFGSIVRHSIDLDAAGGSTGVGHVEFATDQAGAAAITRMNNATFAGATITVCEDC